MFKYSVMQMRKVNCEKGYSTENRNEIVQPPESEDVAEILHSFSHFFREENCH